MIGPIRFYAHEDFDDGGWEMEQCTKAGLSEAAAKAFVGSRPLYEVAFDFMVDDATGTAYCVGVNLGDGEPFTRSWPGQQLALFDQEE